MKPVSISVFKEDNLVCVTWDDGQKSKHACDSLMWAHGVVTRDIVQKPACELNVGDDVYYAAQLTDEYTSGMFD